MLVLSRSSQTGRSCSSVRTGSKCRSCSSIRCAADHPPLHQQSNIAAWVDPPLSDCSQWQCGRKQTTSVASTPYVSSIDVNQESEHSSQNCTPFHAQSLLSSYKGLDTVKTYDGGALSGVQSELPTALTLMHCRNLSQAALTHPHQRNLGRP